MGKVNGIHKTPVETTNNNVPAYGQYRAPQEVINLLDQYIATREQDPRETQSWMAMFTRVKTPAYTRTSKTSAARQMKANLTVGNTLIFDLSKAQLKSIRQGELRRNLTNMLRKASEYGYCDVVKQLLAQHVDVSQADKEGCTALMAASQNGHVNVVDVLLVHGADVNQADDVSDWVSGSGILSEYGVTAFMRACKHGHANVVERLLEAGAVMDVCHTEELIAAIQNGHVDVVNLLLGHGADVNQLRTYDRVTLLMLASQSGHADVVEVLLDRGANVEQECFAPYLDSYFWTDRPECGGTALIVASQNGHADVVKVLLDRGAAVNHGCGTRNRTALIVASEIGHADVVKVLLDRGATVNHGCGTRNRRNHKGIQEKYPRRRPKSAMKLGNVATHMLLSRGSLPSSK